MSFNSKLLIDATSLAGLGRIAPQVREVLSHDGFEALSLAIPWRYFENPIGNFSNGLSVARAGRDLARSCGVKFDLRIRAGAGTPPDRMGPTYIPKGTALFPNDPAAGKVIPRPFKTGGGMNTTIRDGIGALATVVGSLAREGGFGMIHGTWPGGNSAEMYYTPETVELQGHSYAAVKNLHLAVLNSWQTRIPAEIPLEMPYGGLVGPPFIALQKDVLIGMRAKTRPQFIQLNWLDDRPTPPNGDTLTNFDTRIAVPPRHGMQLIHAEEYDWAKCCQRAEDSGTEYVEWFLKQFSFPSAPQLYSQIAAHSNI